MTGIACLVPGRAPRDRAATESGGQPVYCAKIFV
jgi:hypothetical protein